LYSALGLKGSDSTVYIIGNDIAAVQQASGHIFSISGVALDHLVVGFEAGHGYFLDGVGLVGCLGSRDYRSVGDEREVDTRIRDQVGLEFVEINVERTIEAERSGDGRHDFGRSASNKLIEAMIRLTLCNETIQVHVIGTLKTKVLPANVVDSLIIDHEGTIRVLKGGVSCEDRIVWFNNGRGGLRSWINAELQFDLLAEVYRQTLHEKSSKPRTSSTTK
jgi:hypothetical protein